MLRLHLDSQLSQILLDEAPDYDGQFGDDLTAPSLDPHFDPSSVEVDDLIPGY
jgi:hypothetical protein